jgi:hypothetical protein
VTRLPQAAAARAKRSCRVAANGSHDHPEPAFGDAGACPLGTGVMRQVAARYAPICCTAPIQSLRNIGRSISAGFIPPVGVVRATCDAAMVERRLPVGVRLMSLGRWYGRGRSRMSTISLFMLFQRLETMNTPQAAIHPRRAH